MKEFSQVRLMLGALLLVTACEGRGPRALPRLSQAQPLALDNALLFAGDDLDGDNALLIADLSTAEASAKRIPAPDGALLLRSRPTAALREVVGLSTGARARRENGGVLPETESYLLRYDRSGEIARIGLGGRFEAFTLSEDGAHVVAHAPASGFASDIVVADLATRGVPDVKRVALRLIDGQVPTSFAFGSAGKRDLLVAMMPAAVSVLDLATLASDEPDVVVPLSANATSGFRRPPSKVLFDDDTLYVASAGSQDVLMVQVVDSAEAARGFAVAPLTLATSNPVYDIALVGVGAARRVLAVGAGRASLLVPATGSRQELAVPATLDKIALFEGSSPGDDQVRQRALLHGSSTQIAFVDITDDGGFETEGLDVVNLPFAVKSVVPVKDLGLAVLVHGGSGFSLLDLGQRTVTRLSLTDASSDVFVDVTDDHARVWRALADGAVGMIDLATGEPTEVLLSSSVRAIVPVGGDRDLVAAVMDPSVGSVAVLDGGDLGAGARWELVGLSWSALLD
jgi:hypothetical protein